MRFCQRPNDLIIASIFFEFHACTNILKQARSMVRQPQDSNETISKHCMINDYNQNTIIYIYIYINKTLTPSINLILIF